MKRVTSRPPNQRSDLLESPLPWPCPEIRRYLAVLSLPAGAPTHAQIVGCIVGCTLYTIPHSLKGNKSFSSLRALTPWACVHLVYSVNAHGTVFIFPF